MLLEVKANRTPLPNSLSSTHFKNDQAPIPDKVYQFFFTLILSENPRSPSKRDVQLANSMASDAMYNVTNGHVKPSKQLGMGVCDILHKFGHAISTPSEKEIITEIADEISRKSRATPDGLFCEKGLATGLVLDNYDEITGSLPGRGEQEVHDTMSIVVQNRKPGETPFRTFLN